MTEAIRRKLSDSAAARWIALMIVAVTMMFGYFFTDVMSPLEPLVTASKEADSSQGLTVSLTCSCCSCSSEASFWISSVSGLRVFSQPF